MAIRPGIGGFKGCFRGKIWGDCEVHFYVAVFETGSFVAQDNLQLAMKPRVTLSFSSSCVQLPNAGVTGGSLHAHHCA